MLRDAMALFNRRMSRNSASSSTSASAESCDDERVSMENFELMKVLGKGAYGKVYLARKVGGRDHGTVYAMKVLKKTRVITKPKTLEHTIAERQVLERLKGLPFLVDMVYAFQSDSKLHIVMEYVKGGELFTHLCGRGLFDVESAKFIIAELVVAIDSVHQVRLFADSAVFLLLCIGLQYLQYLFNTTLNTVFENGFEEIS
ncbi:hypothetical protein AB6A40_011164 [Gnathostoma spinigerum]|uniref:non-specific serine/threonine protein kinase n=1 Tax=Gnathostoma spinigerum TaxID=75299 RepID=A0ABD6EWY4_9BILA